MSLFFRPANSVAADFIPFAHDGKYHLFYLRDWRGHPEHDNGIPWHHLVTQDFVTFDDLGEALPNGGEDSRDWYVFTGSVIEAKGQFHIFYTGHNSHIEPPEVILHATSADLRTWKKDAGFAIAPMDGYDPSDWRDPFVYRDEQTGRYTALLAARRPDGPARYRGVTARIESADLTSWTLQEPLWAPDLYITHECPDLFRIGEWWYLIYSTYSESNSTHYRMSRNIDGPWLFPNSPDGGDTFDGRPYYAAKSAEAGGRRHLFGWLATREGETDSGGWQWGGNLVVHEIVQQPDGVLSVRCPESIVKAFNTVQPLEAKSVLGDWVVDGNTARAEGENLSVLLMGGLPDEAMIEATATLAPGTQSAGLALRADEALDAFYCLRIEPARQRVVFDRWPRPADQPFSVKRPVRLPAGEPVHLRALVDGTCMVCTVNDRVALSCRMYDTHGPAWGTFVSEGKGNFTGLSVRTR
ncbi:MAG: glycoside hydrolase family 32 protein [Capsulimonadaceae bacterium]|nr:glycoside hydrolase family 32 protein [Capsulimonadaceae bacterium]